MTESRISTFDGQDSFGAYVARPDGAPRAAIIVIQEIFGVNGGIRRKCDTLAAQGYLAVAPDLFWRLEPGIQLDPDVPAEMEQAFVHAKKFDQNTGIADLEATIRFARGGGRDDETDAPESATPLKVGCVGYCLGGRMAFMAACRTDGDAFVGYYGVGIDGLIGESHAIGKPVLMHIAGADHFVTPDVQARMHEGLDGNPHVTLIDHPGLDHGFATESGKRRDDAGAERADAATAAFFAQHLA